MTASPSPPADAAANRARNAGAEDARARATGEVSPAQTHAWMTSGDAVLIDVREADEHARERIPGALLLPLSRFSAAAATGLARPGQTIVLHCQSGRRALDACRIASGSDRSSARIVSMAGGIEAWKAAGLAVEGDERVSRISVLRQVQLVVGVGVLAGSALAWLVHPAFLVVPAFFGAGLTFAGSTGTCALAVLLGAMPWNRPPAAGARGGRPPA